ncbi:MAG: TIM barrel protein [Acidobacteria bacterium]|nr:TIM barrel protein [Acidobacteriota bacterium]
MLRRTFLQTVPAAAVAAGQGAGDRARLGIDTYSLRSFRWKAMQLLDYSAKLGLNTIQISSSGEYESLEPADLQKVKDYAGRLGIEIDSGIGCICPTTASYNPKSGDPAKTLADGLRVAKAVGAKASRCFMGSMADRRGKLPIEAHMEATIKVFRSVRSQALDLGVKIALENHGDLTSAEMKTVFDESGKEFAGCCYDSGNPASVLEDPMFTLETLAPYVASSHFRDTALFERPDGAAFQWVALGEGSTNIDAVLRRFRQLCPHSPIQLEVITGRPPAPIPYLNPEFWKAFPKANAASFARFVALVKKGQPYLGPMIIPGAGKQPPEYEAAAREQQRVDLERSVAYAKKILWA